MNALLLVYPILLLVFTFYGAAFTRGGRVSDAFLSLEQTHLIQAFACLGIVLHHVTQQITAYGVYNKGPVPLFNDIGFLFTALFFFFSGYGLITSLRTKDGYLDSFLYRRLPTVLIPFWIINVLGVLLETFAYGIHTTPADVLCDIFGITLINSNGWFIVEITVFYLLFFVFFRLIRNRDIALFFLCLSVIAVIIFSMHQGHDPQGNQAHWFRGEWWYNSTITFLFGLLMARFQAKMTGFFSRTYYVLLPVSALLSAVFLQRSIDCVRRGGYYLAEVSLYPEELTGSSAASAGIKGIVSGFWRGLSSFPSGLTLASKTLLWQSAACIVFTLFVLLLSMRITLGNRALRYVSTISRELFLIHGYFVNRIFGSVRMNDFLRYAVVLAASIAATALLSPLIRRIVRAVVSGLSKIAASISTSCQKALRVKAEEGRKKAGSKKRIFLTAGVLILLAVFILVPVLQNVKAKAEFDAQLEALRTAKTGDIVLFGRYETDPSKIGKERVPWIVIKKENNAVCLLSDFGIAPGAYHRKHEDISWEDCDLRKELNSGEFTGMFSRYEKEIMIPQGEIDRWTSERKTDQTTERNARQKADQSTEQDAGRVADQASGQRIVQETSDDLLSLLSVEELLELLPEKKDRVCVASASAIKQGVNSDRLSHYDIWFDQNFCYSWWWLKQDPGEESTAAPIVEMDGTLRLGEKAVNKPNGAIRPVIWVLPGA